MPRAVVLLSGGMDSATAAAIARREGYELHLLTVRYGQRHGVEVERAREIAAWLDATSHRVAELDLGWIGGSALTDRRIPVPAGERREEIPATYVPARNTILLSLALAWAEVLDAGAIFVGANAVDYSGYPDCRPEYLEAYRRMAALATRAGVEGRPVDLRAPLLEWPKSRIVKEATALGVPLGRTVSCYEPDEDGRGCGRCDACRLRARGFHEAGVEDPAG